MNQAEAKKCFFRSLVRYYSVTYFLSSQLFPSDVRARVFELYAFLRLGDELVDNPIENPQVALAKFRMDVEREWKKPVFANEIDWKDVKRRWDHANGDITTVEKEIIRHFVDLAKRYDIKKEWVDAFIDSMGTDFGKVRFADWDALNTYVYGSADVVGLMMNRLMRVPNTSEANNAACALGWAMQLTNFLRDLREDFERGRIYIPQSELTKFGVTEKDWEEHVSDGWKALIRSLIARIESVYSHAEEGIKYIPKKSQLAVLTSIYLYRGVLRQIAEDPTALWTRSYKKTAGMAPKAIAFALWRLKTKKYE